MNTREQGRVAESLALSWLQQHGYEHIESNYTRRVGEIDLIVRHPGQQMIVFVEVRYRSQQRYGGALESITYRKRQKLRHAANTWLQQHANSMTPARIDVITLQPATIQTPAEQRWRLHELQWIQSAVED